MLSAAPPACSAQEHQQGCDQVTAARVRKECPAVPRFAKSTHRKPRALIIAIVVVAAAAWTSYALKSSGNSDPDQPNPIQLAVDSPNNDPLATPPTDHGLTSLRATTPATAHGEDVPPRSAVRANWPASIGSSLEVGIPEFQPPEQEDDLPPLTTETPPTQIVAMSLEDTLAAGRQALARGEQVAARTMYARALNQGVPPSEAQVIRAELTHLADAMIFSRAAVPNDPMTGTHNLSSGQTILAVAQRYKTTADLVCAINNIADPNRVKAGTRLKIIHGPFDAVIYKSQHRLDVYLQNTYVRSFPVGLGTNGGTPLGLWTIRNKLRNPDWTDPRNGQHYLGDDADNPIGERWIGLDCLSGDCMGRTGFGIHGTIEPQSIGANMSMGCVRLAPDDVVLLYDLLVRHHSRIEIRP
jgi:lipoprotein-anchoring transpeptidase ErfK/SrfK